MSAGTSVLWAAVAVFAQVLGWSPAILLVLGAAAVAVWASRLPHRHSEIVGGLTGRSVRPPAKGSAEAASSPAIPRGPRH